MKKIYIIIPAVLLVACLAFAGRRSNPPVEQQVAWDSPETKEMFDRACADCHSHETRWPWYSRIAPVSWLVIRHVQEGREHFNVSAAEMGDADEAAEMVEKGEMPLRSYLPLHPEARLSVEEKAAFIRGLQATFGGEEEGEEQAEGHSGKEGGDSP